MTLGGRAAEELVFDEVTTGAANDLEKVTAHGQEHDHALRHEREARPAHARRTGTTSRSWAASSGTSADYSAGDRARDRRRDPAHHRGGARARPRRCCAEHMDELHRISKILLERETIDREQFLRLLDGESEDERLPAGGGTRPSRSPSAEASRAEACTQHPAAAAGHARPAARARRQPRRRLARHSQIARRTQGRDNPGPASSGDPVARAGAWAAGRRRDLGRRSAVRSTVCHAGRRPCAV